MQELEQSTEPLPYKLWPDMGGCDDPHIPMGADAARLFEQMHNEDRWVRRSAAQHSAEGHITVWSV